MTKKSIITRTVEEELPEFAKTCRRNEAENIILHQDAFSESEYVLLGMAIKYAGANGKNVTVVQTKK